MGRQRMMRRGRRGLLAVLAVLAVLAAAAASLRGAEGARAAAAGQAAAREEEQQRVGAKRTYYSVLGVAPGVSEREIRRTYRRAARNAHPDKVLAALRTEGGESGGKGKESRRKKRTLEEAKLEAQEAFVELARAYGVLSDPVKRARYDWLLRKAEHIVAAAEEEEEDYDGSQVQMDEHGRRRVRHHLGIPDPTVEDGDILEYNEAADWSIVDQRLGITPMHHRGSRAGKVDKGKRQQQRAQGFEEAFREAEATFRQSRNVMEDWREEAAHGVQDPQDIVMLNIMLIVSALCVVVPCAYFYVNKRRRRQQRQASRQPTKEQKQVLAETTREIRRDETIREEMRKRKEEERARLYEQRKHELEANGGGADDDIHRDGDDNDLSSFGKLGGVRRSDPLVDRISRTMRAELLVVLQNLATQDAISLWSRPPKRPSEPQRPPFAHVADLDSNVSLLEAFLDHLHSNVLPTMTSGGGSNSNSNKGHAASAGAAAGGTHIKDRSKKQKKKAKAKELKRRQQLEIQKLREQLADNPDGETGRTQTHPSTEVENSGNENKNENENENENEKEDENNGEAKSVAPAETTSPLSEIEQITSAMPAMELLALASRARVEHATVGVVDCSALRYTLRGFLKSTPNRVWKSQPVSILQAVDVLAHTIQAVEGGGGIGNSAQSAVDEVEDDDLFGAEEVELGVLANLADCVHATGTYLCDALRTTHSHLAVVFNQLKNDYLLFSALVLPRSVGFLDLLQSKVGSARFVEHAMTEGFGAEADTLTEAVALICESQAEQAEAAGVDEGHPVQADEEGGQGQRPEQGTAHGFDVVEQQQQTGQPQTQTDTSEESVAAEVLQARVVFEEKFIVLMESFQRFRAGEVDVYGETQKSKDFHKLVAQAKGVLQRAK